MITAVKKTARESVKADKVTKASTKKTTKFQTTKAIETMRAKLSAMKETLRTQKVLDKESLKMTIKKHKLELRLLRKVNREKLRQSKKMARQRARQRGQRGSGGMGFPKGGGGGIGLGSIISGNVIANAITAGFKTALLSVKEFMVGLVGAAADIEKVQAEFGVMLDSGDKAAVLIADLKKVGAETPLQFKDLAKNARILLQYGSSVEDVVDELIMLGDVVGGDRTRFDFMTFAFAQMKSASKLMGQELRQFTNAGFNPLAQMAEKTGLTMLQLRKEMEMGTISAKDVTEAFRTATSQGGRFFNNMATQAKTFHGRVSTMRDEIFMMMEAMGQRLLPGMKKSINAIINFIKNDGRKIGINLMDSMLPAVNSVIAGFERLIRTLFDVKGIGDTLKDKVALGEFFENMAKKIDNAFIFITAGALQLKDFFIEFGPIIADTFGILLNAIKLVVTHLPTLIKLWAGFKVLMIGGAIVSTLNGIAGAIRGIAGALFLFATTNPLLFLATAALASLGIAAKRIFDSIDARKSHEDRMKRAEELRKQASERVKVLNNQIRAEQTLETALAKQGLPADKRALLEGRLQKVQEKKTRVAGEVKSLSKASMNAMSGGAQAPTLLDDLKGLFGNIMSLGNEGAGGLSGSSAFNKKLEQARKTQVTQNFFTKVTVDTDITNQVPEGKDTTSIAEETAAQVKRLFDVTVDKQVADLRIAAGQ
jgi:tape measure domain-containing protein